MPQIIIQNPLGGFISDFTEANTGPVPGADPQYTLSSGIDVFRDGRKGHIAPAEIFNNPVTDGSSNINSLLRSATPNITAAVPDVYGITGGLSGTAPRVVKITSDVVQSSSTITAPNGNFTTLPTGTGFWGEDTVLYRSNIGGSAALGLFYSYNTSTYGYIGRFDLSSTYDDDWSSTVPASGATMTANVPHRMVEGADRVLYITNGQYLASLNGYTGTNGTFNASALNLGTGWVAVDVRKYRNYVAVACIKSSSSYISYSYDGECKVILWDGYSPDPNFVYEIDDNYLSAIYVRDTIYAWTQGQNASTKLWAFTGDGFQVVTEHQTSLIGTPPLPNCVDTYKGSLTWISANAVNGIVCSYGPFNSELRGLHLTKIVNNGTHTASVVGMLKNYDSRKLYASGLFDATYKLQYATGAGQYAVNVSWRSKLYELPFKSSIQRITIFFSQFASGSSLVPSLFTDYTTLSIGGATDKLKSIGTLTNSNNPDIANSKAFTQKITIPDVSSFYLNLYFNHSASSDTAAIVRAIVIDYDTPGKG